MSAMNTITGIGLADFFGRPNARGKPRRSAEHEGHPQAELVGVGLTKWLGFAKKPAYVFMVDYILLQLRFKQSSLIFRFG